MSVSNKSGIGELGRGLVELGWEIVSTGGTAAALIGAGVPVTKVSEVTGFPQILGGRVKTLHPLVHGGILARRDLPEHLAELAAHGIAPIDLVVVNLYPFRETVSRPGTSLEEAIEHIDVGGPTMVRAAAKNYRGVVVVVNPGRYAEVMTQLREKGDVAEELRYALAVEAFRHTAVYDAQIAAYLSREEGDFPPELVLAYEKVDDLRYGENPHQRSTLYRDLLPTPGPTLVGARQLAGKELSYNNLNDTEAALDLCREFSTANPVVVAVKHANPCGVAAGASVAEAFRRARDADPVSIFGGIVALNHKVDGECARLMGEIFLEVVVAPAYSPEAVEILGKRKGLRILEVLPWEEPRGRDYVISRVSGGVVIQDNDRLLEDGGNWRTVTGGEPSAATLDDLLFAWRVVKWAKSNAIVIVRDRTTLGIGVGQTNRIDAARQALARAGEQARGGVLASDAFFPFPDVVEEAAKAGISAIVQPGGSTRDPESEETARVAGITMVYTGVRHFRH